MDIGFYSYSKHEATEVKGGRFKIDKKCCYPQCIINSMNLFLEDAKMAIKADEF